MQRPARGDFVMRRPPEPAAAAAGAAGRVRAVGHGTSRRPDERVRVARSAGGEIAPALRRCRGCASTSTPGPHGRVPLGPPRTTVARPTVARPSVVGSWSRVVPWGSSMTARSGPTGAPWRASTIGPSPSAGWPPSAGCWPTRVDQYVPAPATGSGSMKGQFLLHWSCRWLDRGWSRWSTTRRMCGLIACR